MTKRLSSLLAFLVCLFFASAGTPAFASHLRGTSISWSPTSTPGEVQFTLQYSQRLSGSGASNGSTVQVPFSFGDGSSASIATTVTSINSADDYFSSTGAVLHTYASAGPFTAYYQVCCRVSSLVTAHDQNLRMETSVSPFASPANHSPVVSMPAVITLPLQPTTGFFVSASDLDHDTLSYRLATPAEQFGAGSSSCTLQQPPGLSVNSSTGQVTWDTTQITAAGCNYAAPKSGDLWTVQIMVQDLDSGGKIKSKVPLDVILKFVVSSEAPPTLVLNPVGPITVNVGTPISFTATGGETAANSRVTLNATGLPIGATASNLNQALIPNVVSTFDWTPTASQVGSYVITYSATNDTFEQVLASLTIYVQNIQPPAVACSAAPLTTQYNVPVNISVSVSDPQGEALGVAWNTDGTPVRTDNVPASSATTTLNLSQTFTTVGNHAVVTKATNTDGLSASCTTVVKVVPAAQTITFSMPPSQTFGGPAVPFTATASSGLPVTSVASGACSIVGGLLKFNSAGVCIVNFTQPGNANYSAANPGMGTVLVTPAAQAITFTLPATGSAMSTVVLNGTGGGSGNPVTYTVTGPAKVVGNLLMITGPGTVAVTAHQAGNANYTAAPNVTRTLSSAVTAKVTLTAGSTSFSYPNSTNLVSCVTLVNGKTATGTVSIYDGAILLGTGTVGGDGCFHYYIAPALNVGKHTLTAFYNDPANHNVFSAPVVITVTPGATTAEVDCWQHNFAYGPDFNCDANPDSGPSTGYFTFSYDGGPAVKIVMNAGQHSLYNNPKPKVGTHTVVIMYPAQGNYGAFTLPLQTIVVSLAPVNVALTPSAWYTTAGKSITLTAVLTSWSAGPPAGIGTVSFYDGNKLLKTVPVDATGKAVISSGALAAGTHNITAKYSGSSQYAVSSGNVTVSVGL